MIGALALVGFFLSFPTLLAAWAFIGAVQSLLGMRGSAHIYAAHFALSHAGWGLTHPLAGFLTSRFGFANADWIFVGILVLVALSYWGLRFRSSRQPLL